MVKKINYIIYLIIFVAITYHWFTSPADTKQSMFYALITVFPILSFNIIIKIYRNKKPLNP